MKNRNFIKIVGELTIVSLLLIVTFYGLSLWQLNLIRKLKSIDEKIPFSEIKQPNYDFKKYLEYYILQKEKIIAENNIRATLLNTASGLFFIVTVYFSWRNLKISQKQLELNQKKQLDEQKTNTNKQIAERFNKAVELLTHAKTHIQLGGIYVLGEIANTDENYCNPVMEMLTAYIRENVAYLPKNISAQVQSEVSAQFPRENVQAVLNILGHVQKERIGKNEQLRTPDFCYGFVMEMLKDHVLEQALSEECSKIPVENIWNCYLQDVQKKLNSLTDIKKLVNKLKEREKKLSEFHLNLRRTDLQNVKISARGVFKGVDFSEANLQNADLVQVDLRKAIFTGAKLDGVKLSQAQLQGAQLQGADLSQAIGLTLAQLKNADYDKTTKLPNNLA
jgi:uncharacterized protein YjbI with pentapeptide repeats